MIRHVDAPMDTNVVLWFMYMDANVDAMQSFWFFIYIWMRCYGIVMHDGGVTWCD